MGASPQTVTETLHTGSHAKIRLPLDERLRRHFEKEILFWWVVFSVVYLVRSLSTAFRPFWYDELFTYYLSGMPLPHLWQALLAGIDQNPPTFYLLSALARNLAPTAEVGLRIPAMVGTWLMFLGIFFYVRKRASALYAWLAVLLVSSTTVSYYATEARPYGLVLGFCALALFAWSEATEARRSRWSIPVLAVALIAAGLSHAYAVLIWIPLGIGELARAMRERRVDWAVWATLAGAMPVFAIYVPIQRALHGSLKYTWSKPDWERIPESYAVYFQTTWLLLLTILFAVGCFYLLKPQPAFKRPSLAHFVLPVHETVALMSLALLPVFGTILGRLFTGIFTGRYAIESVIAIGVLCAILCHRALSGAALPGLCLCVLAVVLAGANFMYMMRLSAGPSVQPQSHELPMLTGEYDLLPQIERSDLPAVISSGNVFLELDHYASPGLSSRLHLLLDAETAIRHTQVDLFDRGFPLMAKWIPLRGHLDNYGEFIATHPHFLVYGPWDNELVHDWLVYRLISDHATLVNLGRTDLAKTVPPWTARPGGWRYLYLFDVTVAPAN